MAIQTSFSNLTALLIDDMPSQQTTLRGLLGMLGIGKVDVAGTAEAALRHLSTKRYGLVLCDYNLNSATDGQQLLEHLRENELLSPDCPFFMVSAEAAYASVAAATEHRPDGYLLKPVSAGEIEQRLQAQLEKRQALRAVHQRQERKDWPGTLAECDVLLAARSRWTMQVLQIKARALLQLGRHEEARAVYEQALAVRGNLVWAQVGRARACKAGQLPEEAMRIAREVLQSPEGAKNLEAFDVLIDCLEDRGDGPAALAMLQRSAEVMPSARRQRLVADCAYRQGELDTAKAGYARVLKATRGSIAAQPQDSVALAQTLIDRGETREALALLDEEARGKPKNAPGSVAELAVRGQALQALGDLAGAAAAAERARGLLPQAKADFATVALAKLELKRGNDTAGLLLMEQAMRADHENSRLAQVVGNALRDTGHEAESARIVDSATKVVTAKVTEAKLLFRGSRIDEALALIETALREMPENTGVLLQAAQMNCLALRLNKKQRDDAAIARVQQYLSRLDKLMPGHDRVLGIRRYFAETLTLFLAQPA